MLVDDQVLVREGVSRLLEDEPDMRVVASFAEGVAAVRFAAREEPEIAILDMNMPGADGLDVARRLRAVAPRTRLLILSVHAKADHVQRALWAGANGYLLREAAGQELATAVRAVHSGQRYIGGGIPPRAAALAHEDPLERLSARELEVLKLVVEGNTSVQMAVQLGLSPKSVDTYRSRLMTKLDIDGLAALVKFAIRRGLTSA